MFPHSWYPLLPASQLAPGEGRNLDRLGTTLRAERAADGTVSIIARSGAPVPACEVNDLVFAWHGPAEPSFAVEPLPQIGADGWTPVDWRQLRPFETSITNVMRDVVDNAHFEPVHKLAEADTRAWIDGHHLCTRSQGIVDTSRFGGPRFRGHLLLDGRVHGMGLLTYNGTFTMGVQLPHVLLSAAVPLDDGRVQMWVGVTVKRTPVPGLSRFLRGRFLRGLIEDYLADAEYWESPAGRLQPEPSDDLEAELYAVFDRWLAGLGYAQAA